MMRKGAHKQAIVRADRLEIGRGVGRACIFCHRCAQLLAHAAVQPPRLALCPPSSPQVGELLRTLCEQLGIRVWEETRECILQARGRASGAYIMAQTSVTLGSCRPNEAARMRRQVAAQRRVAASLAVPAHPFDPPYRCSCIPFRPPLTPFGPASLQSIQINFERDATEPSGQLPGADIGSGARQDGKGTGSGRAAQCGPVQPATPSATPVPSTPTFHPPSAHLLSRCYRRGGGQRPQQQRRLPVQPAAAELPGGAAGHGGDAARHRGLEVPGDVFQGGWRRCSRAPLAVLRFPAAACCALRGSAACCAASASVQQRWREQAQPCSRGLPSIHPRRCRCFIHILSLRRCTCSRRRCST